MRALHVSVLVLGLVCSDTASGQGTGVFAPSERAAIEKLFEAYDAAFSNGDHAKLGQYIQAPFVRFGPSNTITEAGSSDWSVLRTMDDAIGFFRAARRALKSQGVERFESGQKRISALSADRALVNAKSRRLGEHHGCYSVNKNGLIYSYMTGTFAGIRFTARGTCTFNLERAPQSGVSPYTCNYAMSDLSDRYVGGHATWNGVTTDISGYLTTTVGAIRLWRRP